MLRIAAGYLMLMAILAMSAETIDLTGKVTNQSGNPIKGAIVTLAGQSISDTTGTDGSYAISLGKVAVTSSVLLPATNSIVMNNGIITLSLTEAVPVNVEMFDLQGNLLKRINDRSASAGEFRFDCTTERFAASVMVIRITAGRHTTSFRYLPLRNGKHAVVTTMKTAASGYGLAKVLAAVDTLKVTASGYVAEAVAISSYEISTDITLDSIALDKFSFFVTSLKALQELSGSQNGFGGDLRFGKTGQGAGLLGADSICRCIAERSMPGSKVKGWYAFLSVASGPNGNQVNAIERIGQGPWYDRLGRLLAPTVADLKNTRPANGDATIKNDLPNEDGVPNHSPEGQTVDNHHMLTGSNEDGTLYSGKTCDDWTSLSSSASGRCGFAWPRTSTGQGSNWMTGWSTPGCAAGIEITDRGMSSGIIGGGGGYGGFYCFALNP